MPFYKSERKKIDVLSFSGSSILPFFQKTTIYHWSDKIEALIWLMIYILTTTLDLTKFSCWKGHLDLTNFSCLFGALIWHIFFAKMTPWFDDFVLPNVFHRENLEDNKISCWMTVEYIFFFLIIVSSFVYFLRLLNWDIKYQSLPNLCHLAASSENQIKLVLFK